VEHDAINQPEDVNLYKVTLGFGDSLSAHVDALSNMSSLNSYIRLFDASGNEVSNLGFTGSDQTLPSYTSASPGNTDYSVGVSDSVNSGYNPIDGSNESGASSGPYTLTVDVTPLADVGDTISTANGVSLTPGSPVQVPGGINAGGDSDLY